MCRCRRAPHPTDVQWENLHIRYPTRPWPKSRVRGWPGLEVTLKISYSHDVTYVFFFGEYLILVRGGVGGFNISGRGFDGRVVWKYFIHGPFLAQRYVDRGDAQLQVVPKCS